MDEYKKIKKIIQQPCTIAWHISLNVSSYKEVIKEWCMYKRTRRVASDIVKKEEIKQIFDFHLQEDNHILLFYSANQLDCLWMCKIDGKYINLVAPAYTLMKEKKSVIATFTEL